MRSGSPRQTNPGLPQTWVPSANPPPVGDLEELTESDLERLRVRYEALGPTAREDLLLGIRDTDSPAVPEAGTSSG